jgi:hypothetical protein
MRRHDRPIGGTILQALLLVWGCSGSQARQPTDHPDAGAREAGAAACEGVDASVAGNPPYVDLNITASGFAEHEGKAVFLVTRVGLGGVIGTGSATVRGGAFTLRFPMGYRRSSDQEVLWLIDADSDGLCNAAAGDQTGYVLISAVDPAGTDALDVAITDNHLPTTSHNVDLCNPAQPFGEMLDMNILGKGFEAHEGRAVHVLTRTLYNGAIFGSGEAVIAGGGFALNFQKGYQRSSYQEVFLFVDVDGDGRCLPGTDHTAYVATSAFNPLRIEPIDEQVTDNHAAKSARNADVCVVMNGCQLAP